MENCVDILTVSKIELSIIVSSFFIFLLLLIILILFFKDQKSMS